MTKNLSGTALNSAETDARLPVSIRAYAPSYAAAVLILTFFAALLFYFSYIIAGAASLTAGLLFIPLLAVFDRIIFDGRRLFRTGLLPRAWFRLHGMRNRIKIRSVDQVETHSTNAIRRGGRVYYTYRTTIFGNGKAITFGGGGRNYRRMIRALLPKFDERILDLRSFELAEYLYSPKDVRNLANEMKIPSSDFLADALVRRTPTRAESNESESHDVITDELRVGELRKIANRLRMSGSLVRAVEAFRRALRLEPRNGWLLLEFSRCLHSLAHVERNPKLNSRAEAALRLAERRAEHDSELLERIGETYRQFGDPKRAASVYILVVERVENCVRAVTGLAELALEEGKLAHVVHNFAAANRMAESASIRRWAKAEAEYFTRLSDDNEYMELEVSRMNLLDKLHRWRNIAFRIGLYSLPLIVAGSIFDEPLVTNTGWLVSGVSLLLWAAMSVLIRMLAPRIPFELLESDE